MAIDPEELKTLPKLKKPWKWSGTSNPYALLSVSGRDLEGAEVRDLAVTVEPNHLGDGQWDVRIYVPGNIGDDTLITDCSSVQEGIKKAEKLLKKLSKLSSLIAT
jgi:hypothetical protein